MRRREFVALLGSAATSALWPFAARAQQTGKVRRIGFLWDTPSAYADAIEAFRRGLRDLGWIEGQNITIEYRWADGKPDRMRELAEELVRLEVDILVAPTSIYTEAAKRATSTIPIIFMSHADPIRQRPRGEPRAARRQHHRALRDADRDSGQRRGIAQGRDPRARRASPSSSTRQRLRMDRAWQAVEAAAAALGLQVASRTRGAALRRFDSAFAAISREHAGAVLVPTTPSTLAGHRRLAELAIAHKLPSMFGARQFIEAGGLLSFGPDRPDMLRRGAVYVDKILKGASPPISRSSSRQNSS